MKTLLLILVSFFIYTNHVQAAFTLRDVGVIGLMSHDIFTWDHKAEVNLENGRLDLSTIFDYDGGSRWEKGGNPKNSENAPVYTVTMELVEFYKNELRNGSTPSLARHWTVRHFLFMIEESYTRVFETSFPVRSVNKIPDNVEQAALRAMHDILPGRVHLYNRLIRKELVLTNPLNAKVLLSKEEMDQVISVFDGDYDEEYKNIKIPFGPTLNLKEIDRKFIEKFSPYKQVDMLEELASVGRAEKAILDVSFMYHVTEMIEKALCNTGNEWLPPEIPCDNL